LIPFLFLIRSRLKETTAFLEREERPNAAQILASVARNWGVVTLGAMMATLTTVSFYLITAYAPTYGAQVLKLSQISAFAVTLCVGVSNFVLLPVAGAVADRIGRRPLLLAAATLTLVSAYPMLRWLVSAPSFGALLAVELWFSALFAAYNGAMVVHLTEVMPKAVRTAGFSLAYSLATGIFGGFTPLVSTWLIKQTGDKAAPGLWLSGAAVLGLAGALGLWARERARGGLSGRNA
jgi:MHS family citrate/tricarballylate:H+ symporter-like MFS transporter